MIKPRPTLLQREQRNSLLVDGAANCLLASIATLSVYYVALEQPAAYAHFIAEDNWAEYASFVFWIVASISLAVMLWKKPDFRKIVHFALVVVTFVIGMEEISWGQRMFDFTPPEFFVTHNMQSELSVHNFAKSEAYYPYIGSVVLLGVAVLPALSLIIPRLRSLCKKLGVPLVGVRNWPFFLIAVYFLDYQYRFIPLPFNWELAELFLALAAASFTVHYAANSRGSRGGLRASKATLIVFAVCIPTTAFLVLTVGTERSPKSMVHRLSTDHYLRLGRYEQAASLFEYIEQNPSYRRIEDVEFYHGLVLRRTGKPQAADTVMENGVTRLIVAIRKTPDSAELHRSLGKLFQVLGRIAEAERAYARALDIHTRVISETFDQEDLAEAQFSLAMTFYAAGLPARAKEHVERAARTTLRGWKRKDYSQWVEKENRRMKMLDFEERPPIDVVPSGWSAE